MKNKFFALTIILSGLIPLWNSSAQIFLLHDDLLRTELPLYEFLSLGQLFPTNGINNAFLQKSKSDQALKDSTAEYIFISSTDSLPILKSYYGYDESGNNISSLSYDWNETEGVWEYSTRWEYAYDENSNQVLSVTYKWDEITSDWLGKGKTEHAYDEQGNHTRYIRYIWNTDSADWIRSEKSELLNSEYDSIVLSGYSIWDTTNYSWCELARRTTYYTLDGLATLAIDSVREIETDTWSLYATQVYGYSQEGLLLSDERYTWTNDGADSSGVIRWDYEYDDAGRQTLMTMYDWAAEQNAWVPEQHDLYSYDAEGNLAEVIRDRYDEALEEWSEIQKWELIYTEYINTEVAYTWNEETTSYELLAKSFTFFRHDIDPVIPFETIGFTVSPNPAEKYISISGGISIEQVSIYSLQGILIMLQDYAGGTIDISDLPEGMYILRVNEDSGNAPGSLFIKY
jgi:hypothetical protein